LGLLEWTIDYFRKKGVDTPRSEAEVLLAHTLGLRRIDLYLRYDQPLSPDELVSFKEVVRRRVAHEPSQYITGRREFWSLEFEVNPAVLIPRPETEILVERAVDCILERGYRRVLEIGTGSGAIIVSVAHELPVLDFLVATDISTEAIAVARRNALKHGVAERISFVVMDLFSAFRPGTLFDLIVSNPPYVSREEYETLAPEIRNHEPPLALLGGGPDGLDTVKAVLAGGWDYIAPGGVMLVEIGYKQAQKAMEFFKEMLKKQGEDEGSSCHISVIKDYAGLDRVLCVEKKLGAEPHEIGMSEEKGNFSRG